MNARTLVVGNSLPYQRLCRLAIGILLLAALLNAAPTFVRVRDVPTPIVPPTPAMQTVPPAAIPAIKAALAANDAADYDAVPSVAMPGAFRTTNSAQRFATTFTAEGVQVAPDAGPTWTMQATAIRTETGDQPLAAALPMQAGGRVEYRRDRVTEWYSNGPRGLEQGFTLDAPPAGMEQFTLGLTVAGADITRADDGTLLIGGLRYGGLVVTDAAGATLPAHLESTNFIIRIAVDARGAQWPVTVDPTLTQATLGESDPVGNDHFGNSVAVASAGGVTTIVVGAPAKQVGANSGQGAVYVFTGSGGAYTQQARLTNSDGQSGDYFGLSVATVMDGTTTTIVAGMGCVINNGGRGANKAYVFTGSSGGATYTERATLTPSLPGPRCFGSSVAAVTDGTAATIAVGDPGSLINGIYNGVTYLFAGSGATYPQQAVLANSPLTSDALFGWSVALARSGTTNTLVVGAPGIDGVDRTNPGIGKAFVFTGSGATYTNTATLAGSDRVEYDIFGNSVAVAVSGGTTAIAVGAPQRGTAPPGKAYLYTGTGATYTETKLTDYPSFSPPHGRKNFGTSVGVVFAAGKPVVAVGDFGKQTNGTFFNDPGTEGVLIYRSVGGQYVAASLPETSGITSDRYGQSVALAAVGNDVTVVGGARDAGTPAGAGPGNATASTFDARPAGALQALVGATGTTAASPAGTFNGDPFHLAARALDAFYTPSPPTGVTFTVSAVNGAGGVFNRSDPNSTTLQVTTQSSPPAGATPIVSLYPSSTAGSFTVTATVDGIFPPVSTTFQLTIAARVPTPTINSNTATGSGTNRTMTAPTGASVPGVSPRVFLQHAFVPAIALNGTGYTPRSTVHYHQGASPTPDGTLTFTLGSDHSLIAQLFDMTTTISLTEYLGPVEIWVTNPPGTAGNDGGESNHVTVEIVAPHNAPTGSTSVSCGATNLLAASGMPLVPCLSLLNGGQAVSTPVTGSGQSLVGIAGGEIVAQGGGNIVAQGGGNIISNDGASAKNNAAAKLLSENGLGLITNDGGSFRPSGSNAVSGAAKTSDTATSAPASQPGTRSTPHRTDTNATTGDYTSSTDDNGVFLVAPVLSNDIPGTHTHAVTMDGIAQPVTFSITNLDPNDGNPATVTSLSPTSAIAGDGATVLTVTGTGFVNGTVISYGGVQLPTTFLSVTQVRATIPDAVLNYSGKIAVFVINPDPNGGASLPVGFTVASGTTTTLRGLSPNGVPTGSAQFTLTVTGRNFHSGAAVSFNGTALTTTFVSATTLTAVVPASLLTHAGSAQITVVDPTGGTTSALSFTIGTETPLPSGQPVGPAGGGPSPLPGQRLPSSSGGGPAPNPLPPSR